MFNQDISKSMLFKCLSSPTMHELECVKEAYETSWLPIVRTSMEGGMIGSREGWLFCSLV